MPPKKKPITIARKAKAAAPARSNTAHGSPKLREFVADLNKAMKGAGRIDIGEDIAYLNLPRLRTNILGLDVITQGGLPRGALIEFWGPYSSSKTTAAVMCLKAAQQEGGDVFIAASEGFQKDWARLNGLWIPYSKSEVENMVEIHGEEITEELETYNAGADGLGNVTVIQHPHGDGLLEAAARAIRSNLFAAGLIDSIAMLKNTRQLEESEIGQEERGGGGQIQMLNRFVARGFSSLNIRYNEDGEEDPNGTVSNGTVVICINQARVDQAAMSFGRGNSGPKMKPPGGEGLRHAWHLSIEFKRGEQIGEHDVVAGDKIWMPHAIEIKARVDKSKISPPYRSAFWTLFTDNKGDDARKGQVDQGGQTAAWGTYYEIIKQQGAWYILPNGERINGKDKLATYFKENPEVREDIDNQVIARARR